MAGPGTSSPGALVDRNVNGVKALRYVSIAEAVSYILLLAVAVPLKYGAGHPQFVQVMGPIHGVLFLAYVALVYFVREPLGWDRRRTIQVLIASVIPFAPFYVERHWLQPDPREVTVPEHERVG
jgi:integral membrane protein